MADGTYRLNAVGHDGRGNQWMNGFAYSVTGTSPDDLAVLTAKGLIQQWISANETAYLACMPSDLTIKQYTCRRIDGVHAGTAVLEPGSGAGTRPTESASINIGPQFAWYVADSPRGVGRTFIPGIATGDVFEGDISTALRSNLSAFIAAILTDLTGIMDSGTGKFGVWQKTPGLFHEAFAGFYRTRLGVLRKRTNPTF